MDFVVEFSYSSFESVNTEYLVCQGEDKQDVLNRAITYLQNGKKENSHFYLNNVEVLTMGEWIEHHRCDLMFKNKTIQPDKETIVKKHISDEFNLEF